MKIWHRTRKPQACISFSMISLSNEHTISQITAHLSKKMSPHASNSGGCSGYTPPSLCGRQGFPSIPLPLSLLLPWCICVFLFLLSLLLPLLVSFSASSQPSFNSISRPQSLTFTLSFCSPIFSFHDMRLKYVWKHFVLSLVSCVAAPPAPYSPVHQDGAHHSSQLPMPFCTLCSNLESFPPSIRILQPILLVFKCTFSRKHSFPSSSVLSLLPL